MCHFDCFQSLGYRADLIQFDQDGISASKADTFFKALGICNKQVITYELYFSTQLFCHHLPSFPVFLIQTVFDGVDRVFAAQFFPVCYQFFGCKFLSAFWQNVFALLASFPLTGCSIHSKYKIFSRLIARFLYCLENVLDGFFIASKIRCETTFITNTRCKAFFFQKCRKCMKYLCAPAKSLFEARRSCRHDHKFLHIYGICGMCPTI